MYDTAVKSYGPKSIFDNFPLSTKKGLRKIFHESIDQIIVLGSPDHPESVLRITNSKAIFFGTGYSSRVVLYTIQVNSVTGLQFLTSVASRFASFFTFC